MPKICKVCRVEKPLELFHRKSPGVDSHCKDCRNARTRLEYAQSRSPDTLERLRKRAERKAALLDSANVPQATQEYWRKYQEDWRKAHPTYHAMYLKKYRETATGREVFRKAIRSQRKRRRSYLWSQKSRPCMDCGGTFPAEAMDFDHVEEKSFSIATGGMRKSFSELQSELQKCQVVCANCHRVRTSRRRRGLTALPPEIEYHI